MSIQLVTHKAQHSNVLHLLNYSHITSSHRNTIRGSYVLWAQAIYDDQHVTGYMLMLKYLQGDSKKYLQKLLFVFLGSFGCVKFCRFIGNSTT